MQDINIAMPIYKLIECSDNYTSNTSRNLSQYIRDSPFSSAGAATFAIKYTKSLTF